MEAGNDVKEKPPIMEKCVSCGKDTQYPAQTDVSQRENYTDGGGQLCSDCNKRIYSELP